LDQIKDARGAVSKTKAPAIAPNSWKEFRYDSLFEIKKGQRLTKHDMAEGKTPFIGAIESDNGYRQLVSASPNHEAGTITVSYNGSVGEAFYQSAPFWASDDINVLYPKFDMSVYVAMFLCALIRAENSASVTGGSGILAASGNRPFAFRLTRPAYPIGPSWKVT